MQREIVSGGAGHWIIKEGRFYSPEKGAFVCKCVICKKAFYGRRDAETCGDECRQKKSRKSRAV